MYKKISGRFINVLSRIIFFIIGVMSVFALLSALPYISGLRPLIVLSGSMEPVVHTGSLIFIDTNKKDADRGDIVTMNIRAGGEGEFLVTHRVLREEDGFLVTKGDANDSADGTRVRREDVVGTYVFQIPYLGYLIVFIRQRLRMPHVAMRLREVKI